MRLAEEELLFREARMTIHRRESPGPTAAMDEEAEGPVVEALGHL